MSNSIIEYIKSDLYRYYGNISFKSFLKAYFIQRGFNFMFWLRLASSPTIIGKLAYPIYLYKKKKYGLDIYHKMQIGYGFYIGHGGPCVISNNTIIGNNVNISQYCTIGAIDGKAAVIADNVYIGPNSCIVGQVHIGNNVTIGAGSVVTKDIPDNATAAGNYAKVLNYNQPGKYIQNGWGL